MKYKLDKLATKIENKLEEIINLKIQLDDKEKELICNLQDKGSEISTYKTEEILVDKLRRKQELEIKSLKVIYRTYVSQTLNLKRISQNSERRIMH